MGGLLYHVYHINITHKMQLENEVRKQVFVYLFVCLFFCIRKLAYIIVYDILNVSLPLVVSNPPSLDRFKSKA